jgi:hypothetical protein
MTTAISTGMAVTAMTVGRIDSVSVEVAVGAVEEAVAATVPAEVVAEEAVVVIVSPPHAGIRFQTRDLYYCKSPGENVVFVRMILQAIVFRAAYYTKARFPL